MSVAVQNQIRENAKQIQDYMDDLNEWAVSMKSEDQFRTFEKTGQLPAPRSRTVLEKTSEREEPSKATDNSSRRADEKDEKKNLELARDSTSLPQYYKNWRQYDVDEELDKLEDKASSKKSKGGEKEFDVEKFKAQKRTTAARPNVKVAVRTSVRANSDVDFAASKKEEGNRLFANNRHRDAIAAYHSALSYVVKEYCDHSSDEERDLAAVLFSNLAMCAVKTQDFRGAVKYADQALARKPDMAKALFRRGYAYLQLKYLQKAKSDLSACLQRDPDDKKCASELAACTRLLSEKLKERRAHAKKLISNSSGSGSSNSSASTSSSSWRRLDVKMIAEEDPTTFSSSSFAASSSENKKNNLIEEVDTATNRTENVAKKIFISSHNISAEMDPDVLIDNKTGKYIPKSLRMEKQALSNPDKNIEKTKKIKQAKSGNFYTFERKWPNIPKQDYEKRFELLKEVRIFGESFSSEILVEAAACVLEMGKNVFELEKVEKFAKERDEIFIRLKSIGRFELLLDTLEPAEKEMVLKSFGSS